MDGAGSTPAAWMPGPTLLGVRGAIMVTVGPWGESAPPSVMGLGAGIRASPLMRPLHGVVTLTTSMLPSGLERVQQLAGVLGKPLTKEKLQAVVEEHFEAVSAG